MKSVYIIRTSEDGNMAEAFSNMKALFNYIEARCLEYAGYINSFQSDDPVKFNYSNMVKEIRYCQSKNYFHILSLKNTDNNMELQVMEVAVLSKFNN